MDRAGGRRPEVRRAGDRVVALIVRMRDVNTELMRQIAHLGVVAPDPRRSSASSASSCCPLRRQYLGRRPPNVTDRRKPGGTAVAVAASFGCRRTCEGRAAESGPPRGARLPAVRLGDEDGGSRGLRDARHRARRSSSSTSEDRDRGLSERRHDRLRAYRLRDRRARQARRHGSSSRRLRQVPRAQPDRAAVPALRARRRPIAPQTLRPRRRAAIDLRHPCRGAHRRQTRAPGLLGTDATGIPVLDPAMLTASAPAPSGAGPTRAG